MVVEHHLSDVFQIKKDLNKRGYLTYCNSAVPAGRGGTSGSECRATKITPARKKIDPDSTTTLEKQYWQKASFAQIVLLLKN